MLAWTAVVFKLGYSEELPTTFGLKCTEKCTVRCCCVVGSPWDCRERDVQAKANWNETPVNPSPLGHTVVSACVHWWGFCCWGAVVVVVDSKKKVIPQYPFLESSSSSQRNVAAYPPTGDWWVVSCHQATLPRCSQHTNIASTVVAWWFARTWN